jgi:hypothetical protein
MRAGHAWPDDLEAVARSQCMGGPLLRAAADSGSITACSRGLSLAPRRDEIVSQQCVRTQSFKPHVIARDRLPPHCIQDNVILAGGCVPGTHVLALDMLAVPRNSPPEICVRLLPSKSSEARMNLTRSDMRII